MKTEKLQESQRLLDSVDVSSETVRLKEILFDRHKTLNFCQCLYHSEARGVRSNVIRLSSVRYRSTTSTTSAGETLANAPAS